MLRVARILLPMTGLCRPAPKMLNTPSTSVVSTNTVARRPCILRSFLCGPLAAQPHVGIEPKIAARASRRPGSRSQASAGASLSMELRGQTVKGETMRRIAVCIAATALGLGGIVAVPAPAGACPVPENPGPTDPCAGDLSCPNLPVVKDRPCPL